jgi:hypothetical protein
MIPFAFQGMGLTREAALHVFPSEMFPEGGDLSPLEENIDKIIDGLTKWRPKLEIKVAVKPPQIRVEGKDYEEALVHMNHLFLRSLWSDGLPILSPTEARVNWILTGTDLSRDTLVGEGVIMPRGGLATVETLAVNLAMAGGRPEYLPVLIAATEAITHPDNWHQAWNTTGGACAPIVIVNGPMAKQIRLNRGYSLLAPSPRFPAGASIGRAIRFLLMNVGGAVPGSGTLSGYGGPGRYTGLVFAEAEDKLPPDWEPLNVEHGYPRGSNTVIAHVVDQYAEVWEPVGVTAETTLISLESWAEVMAHPVHMPTWIQYARPHGTPGYFLISPGAAQQLSKLGWSKAKLKNFLWEHARLPKSEFLSNILEQAAHSRGFPKDEIRYPMPIARKPENMKIVVAGPAGFGHPYWLRVGQRGGATTARIKLPDHWDQLLKKAEEDLGPMPDDQLGEKIRNNGN